MDPASCLQRLSVSQPAVAFLLLCAVCCPCAGDGAAGPVPPWRGLEEGVVSSQTSVLRMRAVGGCEAGKGPCRSSAAWAAGRRVCRRSRRAEVSLRDSCLQIQQSVEQGPVSGQVVLGFVAEICWWLTGSTALGVVRDCESSTRVPAGPHQHHCVGQHSWRREETPRGLGEVLVKQQNQGSCMGHPALGMDAAASQQSQDSFPRRSGFLESSCTGL